MPFFVPCELKVPLYEEHKERSFLREVWEEQQSPGGQMILWTKGPEKAQQGWAVWRREH